MDAQAWNDALGAYYDEHDAIATDQGARSPALLQVEKHADRVAAAPGRRRPGRRQDWGITAVVDLAASDDVGAAVLTVTGFERLGGDRGTARTVGRPRGAARRTHQWRQRHRGPRALRVERPRRGDRARPLASAGVSAALTYRWFGGARPAGRHLGAPARVLRPRGRLARRALRPGRAPRRARRAPRPSCCMPLTTPASTPSSRWRRATWRGRTSAPGRTASCARSTRRGPGTAQPVPFVAVRRRPPSRTATHRPSPRSTSRACAPTPARSRQATIPVERFFGDVLLVAGGDDQVWPSVTFARPSRPGGAPSTCRRRSSPIPRPGTASSCRASGWRQVGSLWRAAGPRPRTERWASSPGPTSDACSTSPRDTSGPVPGPHYSDLPMCRPGDSEPRWGGQEHRPRRIAPCSPRTSSASSSPPVRPVVGVSGPNAPAGRPAWVCSPVALQGPL